MPSWALRVIKCSFFFSCTRTPEIYTLSLLDALPISFGVFFIGLGALAVRHIELRTGRYISAGVPPILSVAVRSEEHTSEFQSQSNIVCRLLLDKKKTRSQGTSPTKALHASSQPPSVS